MYRSTKTDAKIINEFNRYNDKYKFNTNLTY